MLVWCCQVDYWPEGKSHLRFRRLARVLGDRSFPVRKQMTSFNPHPNERAFPSVTKGMVFYIDFFLACVQLTNSHVGDDASKSMSYKKS